MGNGVKLDVKGLMELADHTLGEHRPMMSLYQILAENFYPERADFTVTRNVGTELADSLVDSYPILVRRDLGDSLHAMLRDGDWFDMDVSGETDQLGRMWLEWATKRMRKLFEDRGSNFVRATKEGDHDFITFGDCVISIERNRKADGLLFRCWHLKDCSWFEDESGSVCGVVRKWKPKYHEMVQYFGNKGDETKGFGLHKKVLNYKPSERFKEGDVRHIVIPSYMYGDKELESRYEYVSIFIDVQNKKVIEETGMNHNMYIVPRFKTIPGSPFAYSPATVIGLPDARSVQQMQHTMLEAAERYTRPPIIATSKVIRGDVDLASDGITWVDDEYDERKGAALRPIAQDRGGFPIGLEMKEQQIETLRNAFYANRLSLPDTNREMTAYEVSARLKQYRRENLPLFSPIEIEYSGRLCETAFYIAMQSGYLGSPYDIPESLRDRDVVFKFRSPLSESEEEKKVEHFRQVVGLAKEGAEVDPAVLDNLDIDAAYRDAATGSGAPESWQRPQEVIAEKRESVATAQAVAAEVQVAAAAGGEPGV